MPAPLASAPSDGGGEGQGDGQPAGEGRPGEAGGGAAEGAGATDAPTLAPTQSKSYDCTLLI